jgi:hypothetical protein
MKSKPKELSLEECRSIIGGDNNTQRLFRFVGSIVGGIVAGQPYAAYGKYAGMK